MRGEDCLECANCMNSEIRDDGTLWCVPMRMAVDPERDACESFDPFLEMFLDGYELPADNDIPEC